MQNSQHFLTLWSRPRRFTGLGFRYDENTSAELELGLMPFWMWLATGGLLLVIEMLTVNLLFASLAFSAVLAAIASAVGFNVLIQGALFGLGAAGSLLILRPIALRHLKRSPSGQATNVEALVGAPAIALSLVTDRDGQVKLSGETWSARSLSGQIADGSSVEVVAIEGATAVVKQKG